MDRLFPRPHTGAVVVANVGGNYYAVNAKCPHLGLPMKRGAIEVEGGEPVITCNFHRFVLFVCFLGLSTTDTAT